MNEIIISAIAGFISATLISVIGHYFLLNKIKREAAEGIKVKYFEKLLQSYQHLWTSLKPTSEFEYEDSLLDLLTLDNHKNS